jgi:hypothetical protein
MHRSNVTARTGRRQRLGGAAAAAFAAVALCGCAAPDAAFVRGERATYHAIAPEYLNYVADDAALGDEQKARRQRTVQTWDLSIRQHERPEGAQR